MLNRPTKKIFILGCERSGSTWISNLLDANPQVITYLEPFADYANLFLSFPPRYIYQDVLEEDQKKSIDEIFSKLYFLKYAYSYKPGKSPFRRHLDRKLFRYISSTEKRTLFELLSLNNLSQSVKYGPDEILTEVIKELRLNLKVGVLNQCFPNASYIVAIRHPQLQVESILEWFSKGRLVELRRNLSYFRYQITLNPRYKEIEKWLSNSSQNEIEKMLFAYWVINYDTLMEDLQRLATNFVVVKNESLITEGLEVFQELDEFNNVSVRDYYKDSTSIRNSKKNPVNTFRESKQYLSAKMENLSRSKLLEELMITYESRSINLYFG